MKASNLITIIILFIGSISFAQTPEGFNYQAVVRDNGGNIIVNTTIGVQFNLHQTTTTGTIIYTETHNPTTNGYGVFNVVVGQGTTTDSFNTINWASDIYFLETSIDPTGSTTYASIGTTQLLSVPYALNAKTADNVTGLEAIDEGSGNGLVKIGRMEANYGNIGENAVDLSYSDSASASKGATGLYSTSTGWNTSALGNASTTTGVLNIASGHIATAMGNETVASGNGAVTMGDGTVAESFAQVSIGTFNIPTTPSSAINFDEADRVFVIGNGTAVSSESDALTVLKNGTITAPSFDLVEITDDKALITKEYADANYTDTGVAPTGLETIDEGNGNGLAIIGRTATNYGAIGKNAIDLSFSSNVSNTYGAKGSHSIAMGQYTTASTFNSTAMGYYTTASGYNTTAMGYNTNANSWGSTALGRYNIGGGTAVSWVETESLFEIGNGTDAANKSNALTVLKNGTITAPSFDLDEITDDKALITKEYFETSMGLVYLDETGDTIDNGGLIIAGRTAENYGDIGENAIDLSHSDTTSATYGATGLVSTAIGYKTTAYGDMSTAMGFSTNADSQLSLSIGRHNVGGGTVGSWVETESLFEIGNGTNAANKANALTVLKNGNTTISGTINGVIETKISPIFNANWANFGGFENVTYYIDNGRVYIDGVTVKTIGILQGEVIFTLPIGFRPAERVITSGTSVSDSPRIAIDSNGEVIVGSIPSSGSYISLTGINFRID